MRKKYQRSPEGEARRIASLRTPEHRAIVSKIQMGHTVSAETRAKISAANSRVLKGRKLSDSHRANMSKERIERWKRWKSDPEFMEKHCDKLSKALKGKYAGDKASQWKGGVTQNKRESRQNWAWQNSVLVRDNYTCQFCGQYDGDKHVDHIKSWSEYPELRFDISNGRTLCRSCHYYLHFKKKLPVDSKWGIPRRLQNHSLKVVL
jgi:5-methylcytosine-specific restriction endonuclease McrA